MTKDGRIAYVTNFGDGTVSSYEIAGDGSLELRDPVAASTREGEKGIRDEAISGDGRYLYAIDADAQKVFGWTVGQDGELTSVGESRECRRPLPGWPPAERGRSTSPLTRYRWARTRARAVRLLKIG